MNSVHHTFNTELATKLKSVELAIMIHHFSFWIDFNKRAKKNEYDGRYWMYQTMEQIALHFPYWTVHQIRRYIDKLVEKKILIKGNFNKNKYDQTLWYSFHDNFYTAIWRNCQKEINDLPTRENESAKTYKVIDTKTDAKEKKKEATASLSQESLRLSSLLKDQIKRNDKAFEAPDAQLKKWALEIDRMNRIDKRSWDEIERLILFAHENEFWRSNILSGNKLRKKATQLLIQMNRTPSTGESRSTLYDQNRALANEKLSHFDMRILRIDDNQVSVKVGGKWMGATYEDHGLIDRVNNLLRLGGHL